MAPSFDASSLVATDSRPVQPPSGARNPFLFVVGTPRSGTTMLKRMLAAHPLVAMTRETHWIPGIYERRRGLSESGAVTLKTLDKLFRHPRFEQIRPRRERMERWLARKPEMTYAQLVTKLFDRYGAREGKPLVGDKTPTYVSRIPTLAGLWPAARFIHLVRDGRDVLLSLRGWRKLDKAAGHFETWRDDPVVTAALWWKALVGLGREDGSRLAQGHYVEVRYESLVAQPESHCRDLAKFLGLPYDPHMVRYHEGHPESESTPRSVNDAWLPPTPGLRDWRRDLTDAEVERFDAAAGDLLAELGYERAFLKPSPTALRQVTETRQRFAAQAAAAGWRLPHAW